MTTSPKYLFIILFLPLLLILFLHFFGTNQFHLPIYHQQPQEDYYSLAYCGDEDYSFPYQVSFESTLPLQGVTVVVFINDDEISSDENEHFFLYKRLMREMKKTYTSIIFVTSRDVDTVLQKTILLDLPFYRKEKECYYFSKCCPLVLVDAERNIRGYYSDVSDSEIDRLKVELEILRRY